MVMFSLLMQPLHFYPGWLTFAQGNRKAFKQVSLFFIFALQYCLCCNARGRLVTCGKGHVSASLKICHD